MENKIKKLLENIDVVCIFSESNLFYFTKYTNADAIVLLTNTKKYYITDKRIFEEAKEILKDFEVIDSEGVGYSNKAKQIFTDIGAKTIGYEGKTIKLSEMNSIHSENQTFIDISDRIDYLRSIKTDEEIDKIAYSQRITDQSFDYILTKIKPGITETEIASLLNSYIYSLGGTLAFDTIVAFGKNTANPHAHPSNNVLQQSDCITIDFGAKYNGYCSDMTRSFCIGKPDNEYISMYNLVLTAQENAIANLKAGITGKDGDNLSRKIFKSFGVEEYFCHSLGHSLGIDIHESPNLSPRSDVIIPEKAILSVEPGLYFPQKFGIRIEDIIVFQKTRVENLTNSPKHLIIL